MLSAADSTSPMITVTRARTEHVDAIRRLWIEFMDFHAARNPHYARSDDGDALFAEYVTRLLDDPDARVLVALEGDAVLGYAVGKIDQLTPGFRQRRYGFISDVAITAAARRAGLGARFDDALRAWFHGAGVRRVQLRAATDNEVAMAFWRKRGYRPVTVTLALDLEA
jgi:GNAT superfamily N-acetyltransferase